MTDFAIQVENLSKRYRIGARQRKHRTFASAAGDMLLQPVRNLRRLRSLSSFSENQVHEDDIIWALRDVSFDVRQGEVLGIIGRNGSGKSTLLKVLSRITEPTAGRATVRGRVSSLLEVGTGFNLELTGRENVYLNGTILGMTKREIDTKFDEIVDFSGVEQFIDTPVKRYSSGMTVRLAFSVAAHLEPEILLIDEVLAVGDAEFQRKCLGTMGKVASGGRTVLFVSHNMGAVQTLCHRAVILKGGQVAFTDSTSEAIKHYVSDSSYATNGMIDPSKPLVSDDGAICIESARITSRGKYDAAGYGTAEPLEFEVHCRSSRHVPQVALGIGLDNALGERVTTLHSTCSLNNGASETAGPGAFTFRCAIDHLTLIPGRYSVKLSLESARGAEIVAEEAMGFEVLQTLSMRPQNGLLRGIVLCPQSWEITRARSGAN